MLNFREELDKAKQEAAEKHYLNEVEDVFSRLLKMLKESKPIEILSAREVVICISRKEFNLLHIQARCKTYGENECLINEDVLNTVPAGLSNQTLDYLKLVVEFVLRSQKIQYTTEYKPIIYDNITPASYPAYEIKAQF